MISIKTQNNFHPGQERTTGIHACLHPACRLLSLCCFLLVFFCSPAWSQQYGNEWINFSQKYYKFGIAKNGLYRIDSTSLANAGIPLATIDPRNFQLFGRGAEQYIYIKGESDGQFNGGDYIEFYAQKNDGYLDSILYKGSINQPNPHFSLFNDTASYYLTWNASASNKRYTQETDTAFGLYTADNWVYKETLHVPSTTYYNGETNAIDATDNEYVPTEGWFGNEFSYSAQATISLNTPSVYSPGPAAAISMALASESNHLITPDQVLTIQLSASTLGTYTYDGYKLLRYSYTVNPSSLTSSNTFTFINSKPAGSTGITSSGRVAVSWIRIKYPHSSNLGNVTDFLFSVPDNGVQPKAFLNFTSFNDQGTTPLLYDITNNSIVPVVKQSGIYKALVPNSGNEKKLFLSSEKNSTLITALQAVNATGMFTNFTAGAPDSAYIIITHPSLMAEANVYKNYRSSAAGRSYKAMVVDVTELYDQFAYGINKHPLAIRRFSDLALNQFPSPPNHLFLLGKSVHAAQCRLNPGAEAMNLVPSFGNPSSDILITAGLVKNTHLEPAIPTGRLSARIPAEVTLYLDKVKEFESAPYSEWMKRGMHFGGGTDIFQQQQFSSFLDSYRKSFEDTLFGGKISTFLKTSTAPIQINLSDSIRKLLDGGISLMTMFGHASLNAFDQSIDKPSSYNNKGKYPFLLSNGCYSGDIHTTSRSASEEFVIIKDKGVIAYLGSVFLGVPSNLDQYSKNLYQHFCSNSYGVPVSTIIRKVIKTIQDTSNLNNTSVKAVCLEMTLHGDPAIIINSHKLPDYSIASSDVFFDVTSQVDSITVFSLVKNLGRAIRDSFIVEVIRTYPDGSKKTFQKKIIAPLYKDTVPFTISADYATGVGLNTIKVTVDRFSEIAELSETNNTTIPDVNLFLKGIDIVPVYPYKYAIIPNNTVTLKASITNVFSPLKNYVFQVDTNDAFTSPLDQTTISSVGGVVTWTPNLTLNDSMVYYWRVSPDSVGNKGYNWKECSFQYIQGKRGWGQAHFFQFKNDKYQFVYYNKPQRTFEFVNDVKTISAQTGIYNKWFDVGYKINSASIYQSSCALPGFTFAVFDPISANPLTSQHQSATPGYGQYGNVHCDLPTDPGYAFDFYAFKDPLTGDTVLWRKKIRDFIDSIPAGHNVLCYTNYNTEIHRDTSLYGPFEKLGSGSIRTIPSNRALILWGKKGAAPGTATEVIGDSAKASINFSDTIISNWNSGSIESEIIGPAQSWGSLHWRQYPLEGPTKDSVRLDVIGITANNTKVKLINALPVDSGDIYNLAAYADAALYPYLKLVVYMLDDSLRTPAYMDRWQVIYAPLPEAAVNPQLGFYLLNDTLQEGDDLKFSVAVENISELDFTDTLLFSYSVYDKDRKKTSLPLQIKAPPLSANTFVLDTLTFNTAGYAGLNSLWFEFNPLNQQHSQLEQYHFNNTAQLDFLVGTDKINPLLDVTFDGTHILNGDIISAKPIIQVKLKDENKFLALNDTSDFAVYITRPGQSLPERIYFGSQMAFTAAVLPDNSCKITYTPTYTQDGKYKLSVEGKDRSDNASGTVRYEVEFEVVLKQTITSVMNYPNPFSTSTRFVFTLTGSEVPDNFRIQIMTITGKVVKEIDRNELGNIRIGRNITEYAWDGKDEFGDRLANGVYLYRVIVKSKGQSVEKAESGADQYFTKDFGKMYMIR